MKNCLDIENLIKCFNLTGSQFSEYNVFVETGTAQGWTIQNLYNFFDTLYTIELSYDRFQYFDKIKKENNLNNVNNFYGDSSKILPDILKTISENNKCVFWLDGHWSGGDSARGDKDVPLIEECLSIDNFYKGEDAFIIIDDIRLFGTFIHEDWSDISIDSIKNTFKNFDTEIFDSENLDVLIIKIFRKNNNETL